MIHAIGASCPQGFLEAHDSDAVPKGTWTITDVRDVADAHLLAATTPAAVGQRYIVSQEASISAKDITDALQVGWVGLS